MCRSHSGATTACTRDHLHLLVGLRKGPMFALPLIRRTGLNCTDPIDERVTAPGVKLVQTIMQHENRSEGDPYSPVAQTGLVRSSKMPKSCVNLCRTNRSNSALLTYAEHP